MNSATRLPVNRRVTRVFRALVANLVWVFYPTEHKLVPVQLRASRRTRFFLLSIQRPVGLPAPTVMALLAANVHGVAQRIAKMAINGLVSSCVEWGTNMGAHRWLAATVTSRPVQMLRHWLRAATATSRLAQPPVRYGMTLGLVLRRVASMAICRPASMFVRKDSKLHATSCVSIRDVHPWGAWVIIFATHYASMRFVSMTAVIATESESHCPVNLSTKDVAILF